ncbi:TPA: autoinducer-2 kinase [Escherichia coli]|nr:autoinducer-2 kinase [Escherichia coli]
MARLFTPSESKYYLMALDAGTGSIRAVIFDLEGNQIAVGQAEWRHLAVPDVPGSMEFDLNKNWQLACECMRQALHNAGIDPEYIAAVSACSMREGIVLYNNEGTPIWACANVDARAAREVSELKELHNNTFENEVYRATGQTLALSAIPRLLWLAHHRSDIYRQASTITMISDWLAYMLSGELAVDPSNAGTTGLLDLTTRDWKPALLDMAGLRADILSPVKETGTLLGVVSSQAAELCGLKAGTPVVVGGGDVQLGSLGLGVVRPAQTAVLGGTFWQQVVNLAAPVTDPEMNVRVNPHVIPGMVQAESISFFTGLTMRWFRDAFCAEEKLIAERLGIDTYTLLEEMASRVPPGSWGVMPIFSDRMRFKTWYHAAPSFINLSIDPDKCNKATLFRALEENAAIVSACNLQQIADFSNIHPSSLVFAGGGSKGKLWSQILADVSGLPVNIPVVKEATALGCAIAAGVGAGIFSSMAETGERLVRWERTHTPDPEKHELYQDSRDKWQAVYQDQLGLVDHGLTTSLWKAPGLYAGNFALTTGTVEAGAYVYTLAKGKGNDEKNWYLTSKWDGVTPADTPDPINNPPVVDPESPSVYRPEAGSYISNIAAANSLFSHRLHDRLGEPQYTDSLHSQGAASSMWMRHVGGHERSRAGDGQLNTQANRYVLQLGGDLAQWSSNAQDRWHLGVMAGYANQHSNTQSNRVGYKSDGRISGYSAGLYATWYQNDANKTGAYVDSWALYNWFDNSVSSDNRSADDYDSRGVTASVEGGYTFEAGTFSGSEGTLNTWYVQPQAQITWMGVKDSDHTRKDGTRIETEGDGNVQTRLGVKTYLNSHHQRDDGKQREFQPYIEANWINNSKVYAVKMNGQTVGREGARNLGEVRTGVEAKVNNNLSLWGNVGVQLGDKGYSDTQGMLGVKYSW